METRTLHLLFFFPFGCLYLLLDLKEEKCSVTFPPKKKTEKKGAFWKEKSLQNAPAVQLQPEQSIVYTSQPLPLKSSREQRLHIATSKKISHN